MRSDVTTSFTDCDGGWKISQNKSERKERKSHKSTTIIGTRQKKTARIHARKASEVQWPHPATCDSG
ncbi:hypothetical protein SKAU_G00204930 [Synaphobranchus kaupii]|uniref:Uncharacterized protein n=1 Tax=Synaphobranchus kaupii TaxID=118154 RepID=A0A9Q1IXN3_SYNKA|nr:hypothetical protein SKAU_G00204930 [Synaphobranchus kaupii]